MFSCGSWNNSFECRKHAVLHIPECYTYFSTDLLEETVLFMLNRELMVRGDAVRENQSLVSFRKSCIARLERKLAECRSRKKQLQTEADALYESYALGAVQAVVDTFIKRIYVYKDKKVEIEWNFRENG